MTSTNEAMNQSSFRERDGFAIRDYAVIRNHDPLAVVVVIDDATDIYSVRDDLATRCDVAALEDDFQIVRIGSIARDSEGKPDPETLARAVSDCEVICNFVHPQNALEAALQSAFSRVLNLSLVGVTDDFLQLGGDSLRAIEMATILEEEHDMELDLGLLFSVGNIRAIAAEIADGQDHLARPVLRFL
jgi:tyrocidine synthetase-3